MVAKKKYPSNLKVTQLNANKRINLLDAFIIKIFEKEKRDILAIQEPPRFINSMGMGTIYGSNNLGKRRAIIITNNNTIRAENVTMQNQFTTDDMATVLLKVNLRINKDKFVRKDVMFSSIYCPRTVTSAGGVSINVDNPVSETFDSLVRHCGKVKIPLVILTDSNAHSSLWDHFSEDDKRGEKLFEYICVNELSVCNCDGRPTFQRKLNDSKSIIDLTITNKHAEEYVHAWKVNLGRAKISDHNYIDFEYKCGNIENSVIYSRRNINWKKFRGLLSKDIDRFSLKLETNEDIEFANGELSEVLRNAFHLSAKKNNFSKNKKRIWYSKELDKKHRMINSLWNNVVKKNPDDSEVYAEYRLQLNAYSNLCKKAKRKSYRKYHTEVESSEEISKNLKIFQGVGKNQIGTILKDDGSYTHDKQSTLQYLLRKLCDRPGNEQEVFDEELNEYLNSHNMGEEELTKIFNIERLKWAVSEFGSYKAPGADEIFPAILVGAIDFIGDILLEIFKASLRLNYIPTGWRKALVTFIPKPDKADMNSHKSYRPITLSSFLLKTMERLLDFYIKENLRQQGVEIYEKEQHAYIEGKGTETALHNFRHHVERLDDPKKNNKVVTLAVFIDATGAFDSIRYGFIVKALKEKNVNPTISRWIINQLRSRNLSTILGKEEVGISPNTGVPQGSILGPMVWNFGMDILIRQIRKIGTTGLGGVQCVVYADDVALIVRDRSSSNAAARINKALRVVEEWSKASGVSINPDKTKYMSFHRNTEIDLLIGGKAIQKVDSMKYLGVIFDPKLNFRNHFVQVMEKANRTLHAASRMIATTWGLSPKKSLWLYEQIIVPKITYGSIVTWTGAKALDDSFEKFQRKNLRFITGCVKSTPTSFLRVLTGTEKLQDLITRRARETAIRLIGLGVWKVQPETSRTVHQHILPLQGKTQSLANQFAGKTTFDRTFQIHLPTKLNWSKHYEKMYPKEARETILNVYSDGSKSAHGTGFGYVYHYRRDKGKTCENIKLSDDCSIFTAEITAIRFLCYHLGSRSFTGIRRINIFSDSQSSILALRNPRKTSLDAWLAYTALQQLAQKFEIHLSYIPAHMGIVGNEQADKEAKKGSKDGYLISHERADFVKKIRKKSIVIKAANSWTNMTKFQEINSSWYTKLINRKREEVRIMSGIVSNHTLLRDKLRRHYKKNINDQCRECNLAKETLEHILCHCPSYEVTQARKEFLGKASLDISEIDLSKWENLLKFTKATFIAKSFSPWETINLD